MKYLDVVNKYRKDNFIGTDRLVTCWAPFQAMHINKKGMARICPFNQLTAWENEELITLPKWSLENSLLDIWNSEQFELMRLASLEGSLHEGFCLYCVNQCKKDKPPSSLDFDWVGGERNISHTYPREIELELSNTCNYMCSFCSPFCSSQHMERMGLQNDERFKSVFDNPNIRKAFIEDLRSIIHHLHRINFTGGEPFAQRVVYDILKMIEEELPKDLILHFTTNGSIMNGAVRKISKRPNTQFTISLDSLDPETYPILRVNGELQNVLNNIETYLESGSKIGCSFVISKKNVRELPNIVSWCNKKEIEFTYHIIEPMYDAQEYKDIIYPMKVELGTTEYLEELKEYLLNSKIDFNDQNKEISNKNIIMFKQYIERLK